LGGLDPVITRRPKKGWTGSISGKPERYSAWK